MRRLQSRQCPSSCPVVRGLVALGVLLLLPAAAGAQQRITEVRAATPDGSIRIQNLVGSVRVTGWERDSIAVTGEVGAGAPFEMWVGGPNAKLGVWSATDSAPVARLEVRVPARSRVWVKTTTADVSVTGVRGGLDISTVAGRIEVRGSPAEVYAESMGGAVDAEVDTRLLRVRTAGSDITIRGRVTDAEAYTVSGLITIQNKEVERGRFESVDGGIRYTGGVSRSSSVEFVSHAGAIELALPSKAAADVHVSSFQGKVRSELGRLVRNNPGGRSGDYSLTLGGGGAEIVIRTFKGEVSVRGM